LGKKQRAGIWLDAGRAVLLCMPAEVKACMLKKRSALDARFIWEMITKEFLVEIRRENRNYDDI
jgi:hypothetical protein